MRFSCLGKMNTWDLHWKHQRGTVVTEALSLFCLALARKGRAKAGGPRQGCPELPAPLSPGISVPSSVSPLKCFWLHPHPSLHLLACYPRPRHHPRWRLSPFVWAASQSLLRISLARCRFGPSCFSRIKSPKAQRFPTLCHCWWKSPPRPKPCQGWGQARALPSSSSKNSAVPTQSCKKICSCVSCSLL